MRRGLVKELCHTKPPVSMGGLAMGFDPGPPSAKMAPWAKAMAQAADRVGATPEQKEAIHAFPGGPVNGVQAPWDIIDNHR